MTHFAPLVNPLDPHSLPPVIPEPSGTAAGAGFRASRDKRGRENRGWFESGRLGHEIRVPGRVDLEAG